MLGVTFCVTVNTGAFGKEAKMMIEVRQVAVKVTRDK